MVSFIPLSLKSPVLASEWHPTKNGELTPEQVGSGDKRSVWWSGKDCGHEWVSAINSRVAGRGCHYCSGFKILAGFNDLATTHPKIAEKWHPTKNGELTPQKVPSMSHKKVWWLGECGHEWETSIVILVGGAGCSVCAGKQILAGFNDLATTHPGIAAEWHPVKNGELTPEQVSAGSNRKVWWLGKDCSHEWVMTCNARASQGQGCAICRGLQIQVGFNDLATTHPGIATEWHPTRNGELTPQQITGKSAKKAWWLGKDCGHEWEAKIYSRSNGNKCPICANRITCDENRGQNLLITVKPEVINQWHPTKNGNHKVETLPYGSKKLYTWVCVAGHEWKASPLTRSKGGGCPLCANKRVQKGYNDLATTHPEIASQWHPTRNGNLTPEEVTYGSVKKAWWVGPCGHEWENTILSKTSGRGCPTCAGTKVLAGFNDFASCYPKLVKEWHPTRNIKKPTEVTKSANYHAWWLCDKGHEWEATLSNRAGLGSGCPSCVATTYVSQAERDIAEYVAGLDVGKVRTSVRNVIKGELDVYVPEKRIAIEFNGLYWHSERFKDKDAHKNKWLACKGEGIQLIQVWEDDWNRNPELVKRMLAHKLGVSKEPKVYARSTNVRVVPSAEVKEFLEANHLQGYRVAKYWGLYTRDIENPVLVGLLGVQRKGENGLEIIRFATNCTVVGGFTKLLKHVLRDPDYANVAEVFSYSHNDHSDGGVYERNGFVLVHEGKPGYSYLHRGVRENRLKFSPSQVRRNRELEFVEGATERELAALNGLSRVWDSGSSLWVLRL